jgi:hypothetical protein
MPTFSFSANDERLIRHRLGNIRVMIDYDDDDFSDDTLFRSWDYRGHRIVLYWQQDAHSDVDDLDKYPAIMETIRQAFNWYIVQVDIPVAPGAVKGDPEERDE